MRQGRADVIAWVGSNIVPHEAELRARLRRMAVAENEIGDIVQDAYLKIAHLEGVGHIRSGRAYFFATARSVLLDKIRRDRIVRIESLSEMDALGLVDDDPGPERRASARLELQRVSQLIADLPDRCREIFEMRRVYGLPQREIAERLGLPEHIIEAQAVRGLRLLMKAVAKQESERGLGRNNVEADNGDEQRNG